MKAKLVENIEFKRGQTSKEALDIGGFTIKGLHSEIFDEAIKKWTEFQESLIGEKVTCYVSIGDKGSSYKLTTRIQDVQVATPSHPWLKIQISTGAWLDVDTMKKFIIHNES